MALVNYFLKWKYSNAPEGQRPIEKLVGLSKYGILSGIGIGTYDCIFISQTYNFWNSVNCMSYWIFPLTAMCATFASVAYTTTKIRGKDGYANYLLASAATTGVFYHWQKNGKFAFPAGLVLAFLATIKKDSDLKNYEVFPLNFELRSCYNTLPIDWTLTKDSRGPRPWE